MTLSQLYLEKRKRKRSGSQAEESCWQWNLLFKKESFQKIFSAVYNSFPSVSHINKHIILQSHKHIAPTRSFNRDLHCFLLILKLRHTLFNVQIYYMYSLYPFLHFLLPSFLIFTIYSLLVFIWASLVAQRLKHLPLMWETWVRSLGQEDPLEKEMATHSVFLPGESCGLRSLAEYSP